MDSQLLALAGKHGIFMHIHELMNSLVNHSCFLTHYIAKWDFKKKKQQDISCLIENIGVTNLWMWTSNPEYCFFYNILVQLLFLFSLFIYLFY